MSSGKSVIVVGDGYVSRNTLSSLASKHGSAVDIVAGVQDPLSFQPMHGVRAIKADLWDKSMLTTTLKEGSYCRVFIVLPGHADRLQMGWNGLEAARAAGILQVVLVSVLTAETQATAEAYFKPLERQRAKLGKVGLLRTPSPILLPPEMADQSTCMRIQRSRVLEGWYPMKVKLVQISLPSLDPASRCGKAPRMNAKAHDNGLAQLQLAFSGPYQQKMPPQAPAAAPPRKRVASLHPPTLGSTFINDIQRELILRKEQLLESNLNTTALCSLPPLPNQVAAARSPFHTIPTAPAPSTLNTNSFLYSDILRTLQEQRQSLQRQPNWL